MPYPQPNPGLLLEITTESTMLFQTIGTDYRGSIYYRLSPKKDSKSIHIVIRL